MQDQQLPKIIDTPLALFAFSSMLISEVNIRMKNKDRTAKTITTKLDFSCLPLNPNDLKVSTKDTSPLSLALSDSLKKILAPIIVESIDDVVNPALNGLDAAWRNSRESKTVTIQPDEVALEKKQLQHSAERLAKKQTGNFLATDLHNIFQRITFRGASKAIVQHMIKFNYPLSPHCAKVVFDACLMILLENDSDLKQLDIELKRGEHTILTYNGLKNGFKKRKQDSALIDLERDSFYIIEVRLGLFQALCKYSTKFSDVFSLDSQSFVDQICEKVAEDLVPNWKSTVSWYGNEKLKCSVAIW